VNFIVTSTFLCLRKFKHQSRGLGFYSKQKIVLCCTYRELGEDFKRHPRVVTLDLGYGYSKGVVWGLVG
jgi:hypothetical protein